MLYSQHWVCRRRMKAWMKYTLPVSSLPTLQQSLWALCMQCFRIVSTVKKIWDRFASLHMLELSHHFVVNILLWRRDGRGRIQQFHVIWHYVEEFKDIKVLAFCKLCSINWHLHKGNCSNVIWGWLWYKFLQCWICKVNLSFFEFGKIHYQSEESQVEKFRVRQPTI